MYGLTVGRRVDAWNATQVPMDERRSEGVERREPAGVVEQAK